MVRFETAELFSNIKSQNILKAEYIVYPYILHHPEKIELVSCDAPWSSTKVTWNTRQEYEGQPIYPAVYEKELRFDITEIVKQWAVSPNSQYNGFVLKAEEGGVTAFPSGDNGYLSPRLKITYKTVD